MLVLKKSFACLYSHVYGVVAFFSHNDADVRSFLIKQSEKVNRNLNAINSINALEIKFSMSLCLYICVLLCACVSVCARKRGGKGFKLACFSLHIFQCLILPDSRCQNTNTDMENLE